MDSLSYLTLDGVQWMGEWPYQAFLPQLPERAEDEPGDGRIPGLVDEAN
ncbi:hypothetical protein ACFWYW_55705 [Nonomuraea sp. NPDC059023]